MSDLTARRRAHRSDAARNAEAILSAAIDVLGRQPDASLATIARDAGLSRQTVYAHFPSRETLIEAALDSLTAEVLATVDTLDLAEGSAMGALSRLIEASWTMFARHPFLLHVTEPNLSKDRDRHEPVTTRLAALVERGHARGEFDAEMTVDWAVTVVMALGHAAGAEVAAGRCTHDQALAQLRTTTLRALGSV